MIIYSKLEINRIKDFWELLNRLDTETDYMMYEPNERKAKTTVQELKLDIQDNVIQGFDFLQVATENDKIVGYIRAERGKFERNFHTNSPLIKKKKVATFPIATPLIVLLPLMFP